MSAFSPSTSRGNHPPLADIEARLANADLSGCPTLPITVLRNIVVEPIAPYLRHIALEMGCNASVRFGEYDQIAQEAIGGRAELLNADTAIVIVFASLDVLSWDLARNFTGLSPDQIAAEVSRISGFVADVVSGIRRQTPAMILWHAIERPLTGATGIADQGQPGSQSAAIAELNERLRTALAGTASAYVVDTNACVARIGANHFYDSRYWHIGRAPFSREGLRELAYEIGKYVRASRGLQKKCLVLDCDDVLWGGIVGEDGLGGIKIGRQYPGSAYFELQQEILNLHHRGVILALCSKNNDADVREVLRDHPDMLLRESHFAAMRINWQDKATNLREIAAELRIGLDSMVFVDDSEVECDLVRQLLPEVTVMHLPRERAVEHRGSLAAAGWFDTLTLSNDDRRRGEAYQAEAARTRDRAASQDLPAYLQSLDMVATVGRADTVTIPRVAQLTQKTNQFNLTTQRYSDEAIARFAGRDDCDVLTLRLRDRYGDAGLVGVAVLLYEPSHVTIDTLLLSCRVLGRGVEDVFLSQALTRAASRGATTATGIYRPTAKNMMVRDFYETHGFAAAGASDGGSRFSIALAQYTGESPWYFKAVDTEYEPALREE